MPANGVRPTRDILHTVLKTCRDAGRMDLAHAYANEFEANGLELRPGHKALLKEEPQEAVAQPHEAAAETQDSAAEPDQRSRATVQQNA